MLTSSYFLLLCALVAATFANKSGLEHGSRWFTRLGKSGEKAEPPNPAKGIPPIDHSYQQRSLGNRWFARLGKRGEETEKAVGEEEKVEVLPPFLGGQRFGKRRLQWGWRYRTTQH